MLNIQILVWDMCKNVTWVNRTMRLKILPSLDNCIPNGNTHLKLQYKNTAHICLFSQRPHTITKMKDSRNMDGTIAESFNGYS
jgi:hypothetical protein